jgi:hypothetical protein
VLGHEIPPRFRGTSARFGDPDRLLVEFVEWLEQVGVTDRDAPAPAAARAGRAARGRDGAGLEDDRRVLVETCIDVRERVPSEALAQRLQHALERVGVRPVRAEGQRFDPAVHRAVGRVPTGDPRLHEMVAATEHVGYEDSGSLLRFPEVTVYLYEEGRGGG